MNILFVGTELDKFLKEGGLGDYLFDLSTNLAKIDDNNISVIIPNYKNINNDNFEELGEYSIKTEENVSKKYLSYKILYKKQYGINIYLVDNDYYFNTENIYNTNDFLKFTFFNRAVYDFIQNIKLNIQIIHLNDWHCGVLSKLIHNQEKIKVVLTIHNAQYQGYHNNLSQQNLEIFSIYYGEKYSSSEINFLKMGIQYSDYILTVSKTYISEAVIPTMKELGIERKVHGIINGMNPDIYPRKYETKEEFLKFKKESKLTTQKKYGLEINENIPLFIFIGRLFKQKGINLIRDILENLTKDAQLIILGTGDETYEKEFKTKSKTNPNLITLIEFNSNTAMKLYQSADIFLMPSLFEPCGIAQLIAMYYGTIPIVHNVGGLKDTVINYNLENARGFKYENQNSTEFLKTVNISKEQYKNKEKWDKIILNATKHPYIWPNQIKKYINFYNKILKK